MCFNIQYTYLYYIYPLLLFIFFISYYLIIITFYLFIFIFVAGKYRVRHLPSKRIIFLQLCVTCDIYPSVGLLSKNTSLCRRILTVEPCHMYCDKGVQYGSLMAYNSAKILLRYRQPLVIRCSHLRHLVTTSTCSVFCRVDWRFQNARPGPIVM